MGNVYSSFYRLHAVLLTTAIFFATFFISTEFSGAQTLLFKSTVDKTPSIKVYLSDEFTGDVGRGINVETENATSVDLYVRGANITLGGTNTFSLLGKATKTTGNVWFFRPEVTNITTGSYVVVPFVNVGGITYDGPALGVRFENGRIASTFIIETPRMDIFLVEPGGEKEAGIYLEISSIPVSANLYLKTGPGQYSFLAPMKKASQHIWFWKPENVAGVIPGAYTLVPFITLEGRTYDGPRLAVLVSVAPAPKPVPPPPPSQEEETSVQPPPPPPPPNVTETSREELSNVIREAQVDIEQEEGDIVSEISTVISAIKESASEAAIDEEAVTKIEDEAHEAEREFAVSINQARQDITARIISNDAEGVAEVKEQFQTKVNETVDRLTSVAEEAGVSLDVNVEGLKKAIVVRVDRLSEVIEQKQKAIASRGGLALYIDDDNDGISNYDEGKIFSTDPQRGDSDNDGINDGDEVLSGRNPIDSSSLPVTYDDPQTQGVKTKTLSIDLVQVVEVKDVNGKANASKIVISGRALPNSFVTIFIFSSPITVTVKADNEGRFSYVFDRELADGNHEIYVATADNSGKILAKSEPVAIAKQGAAISILSGGAAERPGLLSGSSIFGIALLLVAVITVVVVAIGLFNKRRQQNTQKLGGA